LNKKVISTSDAPAAVGPYSQAIKVGDYIFISGQLPLDPSSGKIISHNLEDQTKQVLENIKAILRASSCTMDDLIKITIFLKDMDYFADVNKIYNKYFSSQYPSRSCVEVNRLPKDALIEMEAIAVL